MVIVQKVLENEIIAELIGRSADENEVVVAANENGKIVGTGVIKLGETPEITEVNAKEYDIDFLIVQALLNIAERRGFKEAVCKIERLDQMLLRLGFKENKVDLEGYFTPGKHC